MNQTAPEYSAADVGRIVRRDFPPDQVEAVHVALRCYGTKSWHGETVRVRLAILKLADGNREKLDRAIAMADRDYRDVLSHAEYPTTFRTISPNDRDVAKRRQAMEADLKQYRDWLGKS